MYASGATVLLDGLETGSGSVLTRLETGPFLAYKGSFPGGERFFAPVGLTGDYSVGAVDPAYLQVGNATLPVRTLAMRDPQKVSMASPEEGDALLSRALAASLGIEPGQNISLVTDYREANFTFRDFVTASVALPDQWIIISGEGHGALHPIALDLYNLVLLMERSDASLLQGKGFTVLSTASAGDFFVGGLSEARDVVFSIVIVSSVAIGALSFSLVSLEARYRHREMNTLRALGMGGGEMVGTYGLQVLFIVSTGTILGIALGIVVANGLVSFAPFFGLPTIIRPQITLAGILIPLFSSLVAGAIGGMIAILGTLRRFSLEA